MAPRVRLLDLTRSLRRAGRMATGVDRVEIAYLAELMNSDLPAFGLVRTPLGYVLLDQTGMKSFHAKMRGDDGWGPRSLLSRLGRGRTQAVQRAESDLRRMAVTRCTRGRLAAMLRKYLPVGFEYYNVGHSNLTARMLAGVTQAKGSIHVLIHDVIPLEYPQFQRAETIAPFRAKLGRVSAHADRVIYNSFDTQRRTEPFFENMGRVPDAIVAHLGTIEPQIKAAALPDTLLFDQPYFVTVGTIEPRKNHAFLLDLWEEMGVSAPPLLICGGRGWCNEAVFDRLDALGPSDGIYEFNELTDATLSQVVRNSCGVLIPSFAEGYGLPPIEALSLGARVLCNNLAVFDEIVGENADYLSVSQPNLWISKINEWKKSQPTAQENTQFEGPRWSDHFKIVLSIP
jgi:glycosyltransferase involved in cell wall biosynthesis